MPATLSNGYGSAVTYRDSVFCYRGGECIGSLARPLTEDDIELVGQMCFEAVPFARQPHEWGVTGSITIREWRTCSDA